MKLKLLLTCEHASNDVPKEFQPLFTAAAAMIDSHLGWDPGSLTMGLIFEQILKAPLFQTNATRLLVEANRSLDHPRLFSEFTCNLNQDEQQQILLAYYYPFRNAVESWIHKRLDSGKAVLHISLHSFTPVLDAETRNADVGLLYDPQRSLEESFCDAWENRLQATRPKNCRIRRNYPYLGTADGFTTYLRTKFPGDRYLGIELEVNQAQLNPVENWHALATDLANSLIGSLVALPFEPIKRLKKRCSGETCSGETCSGETCSGETCAGELKI